jgi:nucleotide-binding universal stress UspA family protein
MGRIVVGVDGSPESKAALVWALREGRRQGVEVTALYAYGHPEEYNPYALAYAAASAGAKQAAHVEELDVASARARRERQLAEALVRGVVAEVAADFDEVSISAEAVPESRPVRALVAASAEADLVVVGSRGRGAVRSLVGGSLSRALQHKARCPVVVVRGDAAEPQQAV